jgi:hypothetical protein
MYFVERYLRVLKGWVRNMARPESCIAKGYVTHEAMKFATEYCIDLDPKWASAWGDEGDKRMDDAFLQKAYVEKVMSEVEYEQAHKFILLNHSAMEIWMDQYNAAREGTLSVPLFRN